MLDHLDDPQPFVPSDRFRQDVLRRGARLRWRHRLVRSSVSALAVVGLLGGGVLYVERRDAAIDRVEITTQPSTDGAVNLLLVGVDAVGGRTDTIIVVRFDETGTVRMLSIPRDLWDEATGTRINNAHVVGGVQALVDAVDRVTGIPIDHVVQLDFDGFRELVDAVGGVEIAVDAPMRNVPTGLELPSSACATLDGETALALVRARHVEVHDDAAGWISDPTGDLGRMTRSQAIAAAVVTSLAGAGGGPLEIDRYSRLLADHAVLDSGLSLGDLAALGRRLTAAGAGGLVSDVVPVEQTSTPEGAAVLRLAPGAAAVLERYGAPESEAIVPEDPSSDVAPLAPLHPC